MATSAQTTALQNINSSFKATTPEQVAALAKVNASFGSSPAGSGAVNAQGQIVSNGQVVGTANSADVTGAGSPKISTPAVITADGLNGTTNPITVPPQPLSTAPTNVGSSTLASLGYTQKADGTFSAPIVDNTTSISNKIKDLLPTPPKQADIYQSIYGVSPEQARANQEAAQKQVNDYTNQILSINSKAQADSLAVTGQGRGIPEVIIGGQQAQISKEASIATLRITPLLAMAQGNLDVANKRMDDYFKVLSDDATNQYNYQTNLVKTVMEYADKDQQRQLDAINKQNDRNFTQTQSLIDFTRQLGADAIKIGDQKTASALLNLPKLDFNSPTFANDYIAYNQKLSDIQNTAKVNPLFNLQVENARLENAKLQRETALLGQPTTAEKKATAQALTEAKASIPVMQDKINVINLLKDSPALSSRVGTSLSTSAPTGIVGAGVKALSVVGLPALANDLYQNISGQSQSFVAGVHQLTNGLTLQNLIDAKARGATFGALSEGELSLLASSATKLNDWELKSGDKGLGVWNIDESSFKTELDNIKSLTQRALLLSQGNLLSSDEQSVLNSVYSAKDNSQSPSNYYSK